MRENARVFYRIAGFPSVIAAIDGTHVAIRCPDINDNSFYCRKDFHSLNVMGAVAADLRFLYVSARMPGSVHDAVVFETSQVGIRAITEGFGPYVLLGDSGYPLRDYLLTPFLTPSTPAEEKYNAAQIRTRGVVERAFGVLKQRFRVLDHSSGYIMSAPEKASLIVITCACLHNIALMHAQELDINEVDLEETLAAEVRTPRRTATQRETVDADLAGGISRRNATVTAYFS